VKISLKKHGRMGLRKIIKKISLEKKNRANGLQEGPSPDLPIPTMLDHGQRSKNSLKGCAMMRTGVLWCALVRILVLLHTPTMVHILDSEILGVHCHHVSVHSSVPLPFQSSLTRRKNCAVDCWILQAHKSGTGNHQLNLSCTHDQDFLTCLPRIWI